MSNKLSEFASKLIEYSNVASEDEVYSTLIKAINKELHKTGTTNELELVKEIRNEVEKHYELEKKALANSFNIKDRTLTEPKLVWVMVCLFVFDGDRQKVKKFIGNGISSQKVYTCHKEFKQLSDKVDHERKIKEIYNLIIQSYE